VASSGAGAAAAPAAAAAELTSREVRDNLVHLVLFGAWWFSVLLVT